MSLFSKMFNKNEISSNDIESLYNQNNIELNSENLGLIQITNNEILDTNSHENIEKFKNNLRYLIKKTKETKKVDKFMIIRDDDFFPYDWKWRVSSGDTGYENVAISLSSKLKEQYALKKAGIVSNINGINIPINPNKLQKAMSNVDSNFGNINLPIAYRSTKHFTINTPLESTFSYNMVEADRNFTIIDNIDSFIKSGYGYSVSYRDAYIDVTHEDLPISNDAIVLIEKSKYESICKNPVIASQLSMRKVIVYTGDEYLAINMVLSEQGVLPSTVGNKYATYDEELNEILEENIKKLASDNNLLYDKSHGGTNGHFTSYYDDMNNNLSNRISDFVKFLNSEFKDCNILITENSINDKSCCNKIIQTIGIEKLVSAINKYNDNVKNNFKTKLKNYELERNNVTPEISLIFKQTLNIINEYYRNIDNGFSEPQNKEEIEKNIRCFFQEKKVQEQLMAAKALWKTLENNINYGIDDSNLEMESSNNFKR